MTWLKRPLVQLLLLSVAIHGCVLLFIHIRSGSITAYAFNSQDSKEYYQLALNVAEAGSFSQTEDFPLTPDTWRTPGYPLLLAAVVFLGNDSPAVMVVMQQALSVLNVLLLYLIAHRFMSPRRSQLVGVLFLIEPFHQLYGLWLLATTWFTSLVLLTWWLWELCSRRRGAGWCALLGLTAGCAVLTRPIALLIPLALLPGMVSASRQLGRSALLLRLGTYTLVCTAVLGAWMLRNLSVAGHCALSSQSGVVLAYFKASEVVLWQEGRSADRYLETSLNPARFHLPHTVWDDIDRQLAAQFPEAGADQLQALNWRQLARGQTGDLDAFDISAKLRRIGVSYLKEHWVATLSCYGVRCASILTFPLNVALMPPNLDQPGKRLKSAVIGAVYLVLCLGVLRRLLTWRAGLAGMYYPLMVILSLLLTTTPQIDPRFRVPMMPLLLFLALLPAGTSRSAES
jgi:hypothetical protein